MASSPLTLYLFRDGLTLTKSRLRRPSDYSEVPLIDPPGEGVAWQLYVRQAPVAPVPWLDRLRVIMQQPDLPRITRQSAGGVLLIAAHGRLWAATFGTGFHAIDQAECEPSFGLRVAANKIDPRRVTLAETRGLEKGARNAVSMLPLAGEIYGLRVASNEEWIRRFGGRILDSNFAISAAGADSLHLGLDDFSLRDLPAKLGDILAAYESEDYKKDFPFLDYFRQLPRKHHLIPELDSAVDDLLRQRDLTIGFASPDTINTIHPDEYSLKYGRTEVSVGELTAETVYWALDELKVTENPRDRVIVMPRGGDASGEERYTLGRYIVANVKLVVDERPTEFALTAGTWFRIDQAYAELVNRFMTTIDDITDTLQLPAWDDEWLKANIKDGRYPEDRYNKFVSDDRNFKLLDYQFYRGEIGSGQQVEICDLLTSAKELICVKRLDSGKSMAHLFAQGALSASMMRDPAYQERVLEDLQAAGGENAFGEARDWTFVFAVATSRTGSLHELLSFFAKASLYNNADLIKGRGFNVALAKIEHRPCHATPKNSD
ncbi:DUF6119 family protein [Pseudonocardia sp. MH-G8]|uniref:DUF6119 family protein n=1 Tax=Pseudonocardia sp. MH-G8 TaxID=1854588 RepID=UPI000B9FED79|nr:DUF6119 family protein [Pseudonocardia sp. MH-G8]OZM79931.1 hypothetical protein CFP66_23295 [Pseudonocardia sp. MH-G8]